MSQENVDVVLASFNAYNAGDLDATIGFYASDVEILPDPSVFPESAPLHGVSEFRAWMEDIATAWVNAPRYITTEALDLGDDRVLRRGDWGGVGATSGIEMFSSITGVFTVRAGLISRTEYFFDHDRALKAVGLAEQALPEESTTPDLVELSRGLFDAAQSGDFDALLRRYAPDAVWDMNPLGGLGTFEGHAAIRGFWEDWYSSYDELEIEPDEILDLGNGVVFAPVIQKARLVGSGGHVQLRYAMVAVWVEGLIMRLTNCGDIDEARAAAQRLAESRAQADA